MPRSGGRGMSEIQRACIATLVHIIALLWVHWPLVENVTFSIRHCLVIILSAFCVFSIGSRSHLPTFLLNRHDLPATVPDESACQIGRFLFRLRLQPTVDVRPTAFPELLGFG